MPLSQKNDTSDPLVVVDLRAALDGFYGIPQENRLLFSALLGCNMRLRGLIQMSRRITKGGVVAGKAIADGDRLHRFSQVVVSVCGKTYFDWKTAVIDAATALRIKFRLHVGAFFFGKPIKLKSFETSHFRDFVWQHIFSRSVPASEREKVLGADHFICPVPWRWMHESGISRALFLKKSRYPVIDTSGIDVLIVQTPYPGRVRKGTALVVHYHDALPLLMPHTISDRAFHEASHFHALAANVRDGAWFVCVSEATRQDLITLFPEAEARSVTIHNILPSHYFPSSLEKDGVGGIVRRYLHGNFETKDGKNKWNLAKRFNSEPEKSEFYSKRFGQGARFLLMVSTLEPRKNHMRLLEAWQSLRETLAPDLGLVFVGHVGWDYSATLDACVPAVEQGGLVMLQGVPAPYLRALYREALLTVCPSVGEGFDFSGVEAMRCGGVIVASDIPVHREIYGDASEYFDPYDSEALKNKLGYLICDEGAEERREHLRAVGREQSMRYLNENIQPQWASFLDRVVAEQRGGSKAGDAVRRSLQPVMDPLPEGESV
ncbi:glycosyltransferase family 4 protein [Paraburkholderia sp. Ac-20336]|uniref:glycosyltransferase family 4 protein n=1 Tax=Paraburkholderia sp. Ac-20336 TaxID=2703886 RepID=UPI00197F86E0|nr:glycosyltransferase family 1 protein [Paraburkholderia sp. Ac-20336]MBN3804599.1 glycosyltransferase family 4 protein [Paraburkholderia sp. Ac-20336]